MLDRWIVSLRQGQKWLAAALVITLITTSMTGIAYAAEDKVTGIEFEYESSEYNSSTSSFELFVEEDKVNLSVLATISGSTSQKDVTSLATWKSSNTSYVKVDKGVLTGVGKGTATISATYKDYKISIKATSDFVYDSVTLMENDKAAPAKSEVEMGQSLIYTLNGSKDSIVEDITSEAVWTTSNSSIAKVDDGTIELVGTGTVTITAKLKGKSDSISLVVSSPYKSISVSSDKQIELEVGEDDKQLQATVVLKADGKVDTITDSALWTSANPNIASVEKGLVKPVGPGKTTITVSHLGVTTSIEVVVRTPYQSIRLSPEKEYHMLLQDKPLQIKAEVLDNSNDTDNVTDSAEWTTSNVVVATVSNGLVTPKAVGTTKITASYKGVTRSIDVTVYPSVRGITLDVESIDSFANSNGDLPTVTGKLFDGSQVDVSKLVQWSSKDEKIAVIENGKWSAKDLGKTVLTAKIANYEVDVELIVHVKPLKLVAEVKDLSVILGKDTAYPSVVVINEDGEEEDISKKVKWKTSSDNLLLKSDSIKGLEASTVTLTATYLNKSTTVKVKIEEEFVKLVAEPEILELNPNRSKSIKVTGYYKDGRSVVLSSKINWTVSPSTLASVKGSSIKALQVGTGVVSGSYQGIKVSFPIKVTPKLKSLSISDKSAKLAPGGTFTVKLTANYTTGNPVVVTEAAVWTTNKASVATVKDGKITAVGKGSATIRANFDGKTTTIRVTVK